MITAELTQKIDTLSKDEYRMVEVYVDNMLEYSKRRKKEAAWNRAALQGHDMAIEKCKALNAITE